MNLFVKCQRNGVDSYASYEGHDEATVRFLVAGLGGTDIEFIAEEQYKAAIPPVQ